MNPLRVTYFLTLLFVMSITAPTVVFYSDMNVEISELLDKGEEEENKGKELVEDQEVKILDINPHYLGMYLLEKNQKSDVYLDHYQNDYVKISSPPPEQMS